MNKEKKELESRTNQLMSELQQKYNISNMIGKSNNMNKVFENIHLVAKSNTNVLIRGESGTGKELVAHAIHYNSARSTKPFIIVNCSAIPESLIEAELFGYEKGAFTDAHEQKIGKFEAANEGSLFLDEIGELSPIIQVKLLRTLQEKEITRIGSNETIKINVRVITATNRNLERELENGNFRNDLYYRLNVFPIFLPPLKERKTDILLLTEHFLTKFNKENNKKIKRISSLATDLLLSYSWPGNVRELENCIERAVIICNSETIHASHLPTTVQNIQFKDSNNKEVQSLEELTNNFEREIIEETLQKVKGNKSKAARFLKTTHRIISYKINQLNIDLKK